MNSLSAAAVTVAIACNPASAFAVSLTLDDFSTGDQRVTDLPGLSIIMPQVAAPGAIGGFRDMRVELASGPALEAGATLEVADGLLAYSNNARVTSRGWVTYDGANDAALNGVNKTGLNGVNFLIGLDPFIKFDVVTFESDLEISITAWDMDFSKVNYFEVLPPVGEFSPILSLNDFVLQEGAFFDWTRVGAVEFFFHSNVNGYDGVLEGISVEATPFPGVVPLPASALLLFAGLGGLSVMRARRRRN